MRTMTLVALLLLAMNGCCVPAGAPAKASTHPAPTKAVFVDSVGSATTIDYLCDTSASMKPQFATVRRELKLSINELDSFQSFDVICFRDDQVLSLFNGAPQLATSENKSAGMAFVDNQPCVGEAKPRAAIRFALNQKPDLVYLLSGGLDKIAEQDSILSLVHDLGGKTHINCVQFPADSNTALDHLMERIAVSGHGYYKKFGQPQNP